ncbi:MAG: FAD-dependent monooxygenase [Candidatus Parcubacteria bacterium]|nr:FAD-dependent monooxygenase [Burkholderiales bacterium]
MKMLIAGAGPAGLYLAYLVKRQLPGWEIRIVEQNARDSTFGFGVVFSERALEFLRADDPQTCERITPEMETWTDITVVLRGASVVIDGIGFSAIGRLKFLQLLRRQLEDAGVSIEFEKTLAEDENLRDYDLVVAADGANSTARKSADFGTTVTPLGNKFAWFGTAKVFDTLTQTFVQNGAGTFNAHHYRHSASMSTFVFECDAATWARAGFERMDEAATLAYCESVFVDALAGHRLISNKSIWRSFPNVRNQRWVSGNTVLIGDAQRTAHFSIGSGTRLAMEDAIALANVLSRHGNNVPEALAAFEALRRPIVEKLVAAADASADWYENFPRHMQLAPRDFAWSYIQRSGRIDPEKLRRIAPKFVAGSPRVI